MDPVSVPADTMALAGRLALATLLGAAVGVDREIALKPAGLRTHALVSLGAALVTVVGLQLGQSGDNAAPGRIIQGLVAGIGFIGGGVILHREGGRAVHGLTTAASIWIASGTGVAVGTGLWRGAVAAVVLSLVVLTVGRSLDTALRKISSDDRDDTSS
jgi:putative Mg2+ transporter-C (MgtC) family protein